VLKISQRHHLLLTCRRRQPGGRRQRQHGVHHQDRHQQSSGLCLGCRHRGPPRQPSCQQSRAGANRHFARSVRLPLFNDVPRLSESPPLDTGRAGRGARPQPYRGAGRPEALDAGRARSDVVYSIASEYHRSGGPEGPLLRTQLRTQPRPNRTYPTVRTQTHVPNRT